MILEVSQFVSDVKTDHNVVNLDHVEEDAITLFEAIDLDDFVAVESIMKQVVKLAYEEQLSKEEVIDLLAAKEILPGKGFKEWLDEAWMELSLKSGAE